MTLLRRREWIGAALLWVPLSGCGTLNNLGEGPHVYGGVRGVGRYHEPSGNMLSYCDLPFSFALDTGLLPVTLLAELSRAITGWPPCSPRLYGDPNYGLSGNLKEAKRDLATLTTALELHRVYKGAYPASLSALYRKPGAAVPEKWDGIYLIGNGTPRDPWGQPYVYRCPGLRNPNGYDLYSCGPDRLPDTKDNLEDK